MQLLREWDQGPIARRPRAPQSRCSTGFGSDQQMASPRGQVCVLEDDASVRRALCRLLAASGWRAVGLATVRELLETHIDFACVVADIRLGEGDSLELPGMLRSRGHTVPVIFVTASDDASTIERARTSGAAGFFRKPVDDRALIDAIAWATGTGPGGSPS